MCVACESYGKNSNVEIHIRSYLCDFEYKFINFTVNISFRTLQGPAPKYASGEIGLRVRHIRSSLLILGTE